MSIEINQIILFKDCEEDNKRVIHFKSGLNIITGDSKTGKSALIEIIDYCLFSARSSIPVGKITDFADLFVVVFKVDDFFVVIGRPAPKTGNSKNAYLKVEMDSTNIKNIEFDYFNNIVLKPIKNDVQNDFEELIGLSLNKLESTTENFGKLSIRDTVSFLFQHQNLIANKHALFYRFDDINKRKRVIQAFPVLLGITDSRYYQLTKQMQDIKKQIRTEQRNLEKSKEDEIHTTETIQGLIQTYYSRLSLSLKGNENLRELVNIGKNLPLPSAILADQEKKFLHLTNLQEERENLINEKAEIENAIAELLSTTKNTSDYVNKLEEIHSLQKHNKDISILSCPLCQSEVSELSTNIQKLQNSKNQLIEELSKVNNYSKDSTKMLEVLTLDKKSLKLRIKNISEEIKILSDEHKEFTQLEKQKDDILYQKGATETAIKHILESKNTSKYDSNLDELIGKLRRYKEKFDQYKNVEEFKKNATLFIKENMDRIANKLDFEKELKPIDFHFDIDEFSFFHQHKSQKIRLNEMGSGANWLACHLSLFLSLLYLSCKEKKSVIPNFLVIDQPSQVYFPRTAKKEELTDSEDIKEFDKNIEEVRNIFKVLNDEINLIYKKTKTKPQIIALEHANDDAFKEFIIYEWDKRKGDGLI